MLKQNQTKLKKHAQNPQMNKKKSKQKTKTKQNKTLWSLSIAWDRF